MALVLCIKEYEHYKSEMLRLGDDWYRKFYRRIAKSMGFREDEDVLCRDVLSELLSLKASVPSLETTVRPATAVVLMSGSNLKKEIDDVILEEKTQFIIAADGSARMLLNTLGILPDVIVSDLDSCPLPILESVSNDGILFVHAHGDNLQSILSKVPAFGPNAFGTTQVESSPNVRNIGGFMDGDRACYAAAFLGFQKIVILGLDFQSKGDRNNVRAPQRREKERKLSWSKASLEFLMSNSRARFFCAKSSQVSIGGLEKLSSLELQRVSS